MSVNPFYGLHVTWDPVIRVEPSARFSWDKDEVRSARALGAEVHDPLWTLYRQWQLGEFQGEDAGAPASVRVVTQSLPLRRWWPGESARGDGWALNAASAPMEAEVTGEPFPLDLRARVELGRLLLATLDDALSQSTEAPEMRALRRRQAHARLLARAPLPETAPDPAEARLLRRVRATVPDGAGLWRLGSLAPALADLDSLAGPVESAWRATAARTLGLGLGASSKPSDAALPPASPSWEVSRLDHRAVLATEGKPGARVELRADPDADGALDWYAFDLQSNPDGAWSAAETHTKTGIPGRVRMSGMPSARWWDFEDAAHSLVALDLDVGESEEDAKNHRAAELAWLNFQLVHGLDWFMVAVPAPVGSLCRVSSLTVTDVFGMPHTIQPAGPGTGSRRWSMFRNGPSERRLLVVAPGTAHHEAGAPLEQLRLARDEAANLVWAIPAVLPGGLGRGRRVDRERLERPDERDVYRSHQQPPRLRYVPQAQVPRSWIPFLPMQIRPGSEEVHLQRGAVAGLDGRRHTTSPSPILATPPGEPLYLREESVPRGGVRVFRRPMRARDPWGRVWVWVQRGSEVGTGEVSSGLRHDLALSDTPSKG